MKVYDVRDRFLDNAILNKPKKILVVHWTGGPTASGALEHLDRRLGGEGSVGYNMIIERNGERYLLAAPGTHFMHNTGLGSNYDRHTISVSFVSLGKQQPITAKQIESFIEYRKEIEQDFEIKYIKHHRELNPKKPDFPKEIWEKLKPLLEA